MTRKWLLREGLDWRRQLCLSGIFVVVLGLSLAVPTDVCTVRGFGDVPGVIGTIVTLGDAQENRRDATTSISGEDDSAESSNEDDRDGRCKETSGE